MVSKFPSKSKVKTFAFQMVNISEGMQSSSDPEIKSYFLILILHIKSGKVEVRNSVSVP